MPQDQRQIPLRLANGEQRQAAAVGNNAAWVCVCGRVLPLLGRSGSVKGAAENTRVDCPDCQRHYFVVPDGYDQAAAREVTEI
jgi:hypothetical protein